MTTLIPHQRDRVTHRPPAPARERPVVQALAILIAETARVAAWTFAAVVGAGAGLMVLDWLS